jgi:hypothetical protein
MVSSKEIFSKIVKNCAKKSKLIRFGGKQDCVKMYIALFTILYKLDLDYSNIGILIFKNNSHA